MNKGTLGAAIIGAIATIVAAVITVSGGFWDKDKPKAGEATASNGDGAGPADPLSPRVVTVPVQAAPTPPATPPETQAEPTAPIALPATPSPALKVEVKSASITGLDRRYYAMVVQLRVSNPTDKTLSATFLDLSDTTSLTLTDGTIFSPYHPSQRSNLPTGLKICRIDDAQRCWLTAPDTFMPVPAQGSINVVLKLQHYAQTPRTRPMEAKGDLITKLAVTDGQTGHPATQGVSIENLSIANPSGL